MKVKLSKVRLSFPALFAPKAVNNSAPKYSAAFLLSKAEDAAQIDSLRAACLAVAKEKWPTKIPVGVKYCVRDGAEKEFAGYGPTVLFVSASNDMRPPVVDENLSPITEADRKMYAGCLVNVVLRLWAQDNQFGRRVNAQLQAVQFACDGEAFGDKPIDPNEEFTAAKPAAADPYDAQPEAPVDDGTPPPF